MLRSEGKSTESLGRCFHACGIDDKGRYGWSGPGIQTDLNTCYQHSYLINRQKSRLGHSKYLIKCHAWLISHSMLCLYAMLSSEKQLVLQFNVWNVLYEQNWIGISPNGPLESTKVRLHLGMNNFQSKLQPTETNLQSWISSADKSWSCSADFEWAVTWWIAQWLSELTHTRSPDK